MLRSCWFGLRSMTNMQTLKLYLYNVEAFFDDGCRDERSVHITEQGRHAPWFCDQCQFQQCLNGQFWRLTIVCKEDDSCKHHRSGKCHKQQEQLLERCPGQEVAHVEQKAIDLQQDKHACNTQQDKHKKRQQRTAREFFDLERRAPKCQTRCRARQLEKWPLLLCRS